MDTIVYRLHNLENYPITLKAVERLKGGKGVLMVPDVQDLHGVVSFRKAYFSKHKDSFHLMSYNAKAFLPSSSAGIQIRYDESQRYISFELSLPKYFFGNNVCELLPPMASKRYNRNALSMHELCTNFWWKAMRYVLLQIIRELTLGLEKVRYWGDVQLARWDIAFNQLHNTKSDALHYLDAQHGVSVPRVSDGKKVVHRDTGNVTFLTDLYYFKVYHKGNEFASKQINQIRKTFTELGGRINHTAKVTTNRALGTIEITKESIVRGNLIPEGSNMELSMQQIPQLQAYADRILRYEFEATSKYMSYVYNTKLAKWNIKAYARLCNLVRYVMREENLAMYTDLQIHYRDQAGKLWKTHKNFSMFTVEYSLPSSYFKGEKDKEKGHMKVIIPRTIERIEKVIRAHNKLKSRFFIKDLTLLKQVHKFIESEKSREHKFFFDDPVKVVAIGKGEDQVMTLEREKNAEDAITSAMIPVGVSYDGPIMELIEPVPTNQKLSYKLFRACIAKHNHLFKLLQFELLPEVKEIELLCIAYNKHIDTMPRIKGQKKEQKMQVRHMKMMYAAFKHATFDQMRQSNDISRQSMSNWKKKCEKLFGFDKAKNYITKCDLKNVSRSPSNLYFRTYDEMLMSENPLSTFLQNTPQLLLF